MSDSSDDHIPILPAAPSRASRFAQARAERVAAVEAREDRENERAARSAMILALVPLGVTQLLALLTSTVAASRYHSDGRPVAGVDRARRARRVALLQLVLMIGLGAWWTMFEGPRRHAEQLKQDLSHSRSNLEQIARACTRFRDGPGGGQRYPYGWSELIDYGLIDADTLRSPVDWRAGSSSYSYLGRLPMYVMPSEFVLAYETYDDFDDRDQWHLVVFADGHVQRIPNSRLQTLLHTQRRGLQR